LKKWPHRELSSLNYCRTSADVIRGAIVVSQDPDSLTVVKNRSYSTVRYHKKLLRCSDDDDGDGGGDNLSGTMVMGQQSKFWMTSAK